MTQTYPFVWLGMPQAMVLSHVMADGTEHPIAFASRTLQAAERNYAYIEKEAISLIFASKNFMYGRTFKLITDHQSLTTILGPKTGAPLLQLISNIGLFYCSCTTKPLSSNRPQLLPMPMASCPCLSLIL